MLKEKAPFKSLSIIMLDFVIKAKKRHYPRTLLQQCKYESKKIKMENLIDDDLAKSSSDESDMIPMIKQKFLVMKKKMSNLKNNLVKPKKVI